MVYSRAMGVYGCLWVLLMLFILRGTDNRLNHLRLKLKNDTVRVKIRIIHITRILCPVLAWKGAKLWKTKDHIA